MAAFVVAVALALASPLQVAGPVAQAAALEPPVHDHAAGGLAAHEDPSAHEASEGLVLAPEGGQETVHSGGQCASGATVRSYNIVAINVDITLNRYLDHEPEGRMFVLDDDLSRVREEEAQNAKARADQGEPAVSLGLQGDAIQPLTLRVNQGECLRVRLRNELDGEAASFHLHGSGLVVAGTNDNEPAIATNPDAMARPSRSVAYEWMVADNEPEGTHYFHSHGNDREQTSHGLFGAVIVEPQGSRYIDPLTGDEPARGWAAIIEDPKGSDFREFALYYHEVGNENYRLLDKAGEFVPQVDPLTSAYRPAARALNYRSEPFYNRLQLEQKNFGLFDESASYSSYVFGDPATPIMRTYLGDPVKQRVIHGGSEVFHVHHVHGGSIRWRRQPDVEPTNFDSGLNKHPPLLPKASERIDAQGLGPAETFDVENECGSGGCQQSVGDFLVH
ncbi:MAG: multicopper oxidase domain-containing protein, partial [Dehalococcoidia bacterium]